MAGCPEPELTENPFTDVGEGAYYYEAVMWAIQEEITNGKTENSFGLHQECTRAHVVTFLYHYLAD